MNQHIIVVSDESFEAEVLKSTIPVLIDFWAEWCGPCKMLSPILDEIVTTYLGKLKVVKMDVDKNSLTPAKYSVRGIPTLMIFNKGTVAATKVGALSKSQLVEFIDDNI